MKRTALTILAIMLRYSGGMSLIRYANRKKVRVLAFHSVNDEQKFYSKYNDLTVSTMNFRRQMEFVKKHYNVITPYDYLEYVLHKKPLPDNSLIITIDDGYKDNYEYAFNILDKNNFSATIFIATQALQDDLIFAHIYYYLVEEYGLERISKEIKEWDKDHKIYGFNSISKLKQSIEICLKNKETKELFTYLCARLDFDAKQRKKISKQIYLSKEQISLMVQNRLLFGSHTVSHPMLSRLDEKELRHELRDSGKFIGDITCKKTDLFCYPSGNKSVFNSKVKKAIREAGYKCAFSMIEGFNDEKTDLFEIRRFFVPDCNIYHFSLICEGIVGKLDRLVSKK